MRNRNEAESASKKPFYKRWWFIIIVIIIVIFVIAAAGGDTPEDDTAISSSSQPSEEAKNGTKKPQEELDTSTMPGIAGSQVYDIILNLEESGIPKAETQNIEDGFQYDSQTTEYAYSITANSSHEVASAQFFVLSETDSEGFLSYCASLPYDTADAESVQKWISENIGEEKELAVGDAIFKLSTGTKGPALTISAKGFEDYVLSRI